MANRAGLVLCLCLAACASRDTAPRHVHSKELCSSGRCPGHARPVPTSPERVAPAARFVAAPPTPSPPVDVARVEPRAPEQWELQVVRINAEIAARDRAESARSISSPNYVAPRPEPSPHYYAPPAYSPPVVAPTPRPLAQSPEEQLPPWFQDYARRNADLLSNEATARRLADLALHASGGAPPDLIQLNAAAAQVRREIAEAQAQEDFERQKLAALERSVRWLQNDHAQRESQLMDWVREQAQLVDGRLAATRRAIAAELSRLTVVRKTIYSLGQGTTYVPPGAIRAAEAAAAQAEDDHARACRWIKDQYELRHEQVHEDSRTQARRLGIPVAENGDVFGLDNDHDGRIETEYVSSYQRQDGTFVRGHFRAE